MKKYYIAALLTFYALVLYSQNTEWASKALNYSSQLDKFICSANQLLGKPNVLPLGGESPFAWSCGLDRNGEELKGEASVTVGFKTPLKVRQIAIGESYNPGSIKKIILISVQNKQYTVYSSIPVDTVINPRLFNLFIPLTGYEVKALKLVTEPSAVKGINQIDAIGISSSEDSIKSLINCIDETEFFSEPENLGVNINTPLNETQPVISRDGKVLFFIRENVPDKFGVTNRNIMFSTLNANNTWSFSRNLGGVLSNKGENGYSVMHDGKSLLLGNVFNKDGSVSDGLSVSHKEESGWSYPEKITIKKFSTSNPNSTFFMSNDNKILLLSLERKNGYGGLDIYVSFLIDKNTYSEPLNLGPYINTVADDCSPFLANDNLTLYYSTSGLSGFGSNDIFMTRRLNQKWSEWTEPLNLGPKINSSDWDAYFTMPSSGEYAYYISYKNSSGEGDVFRIEMPRIIKPFPVINITGRISDSLTNAPVAAKITPFISQNNKSLAPEFSDNKGEFRLCLPASDKYNVSISAEGFEEKSIELDLSGIADGYEISKDIFLTKIDAAIKAPPLVAESIQKPDSKTIPQKKKIGKQPEETPDKETGKDLKKDEDENAAKDQKTKQTSTDLNQIFDYKPPKSDKNILASIFFDYAASELTPTACQLLDSIAEVIHSMPECVIEIAGNADPKGSFASNIRLSIERSKKVREYLTGKNCNPKRLLLKGYSNLFPGFPNSSERSSSLNRRVDIILLQKKRFESLLEK